ncbi:MAG: hypothetical protein K6U12_12575, partial [Armatimonadetes bacterium]|nr:hypothetical protein [Armatimonadota bacterium]
LYPIGVGEVKLWRRSDSDLNSSAQKLVIDAKWVFGVQDVVCGSECNTLPVVYRFSVCRRTKG